MFTKKTSQDVRKSSSKIFDQKRDPSSKLKHLKIILDHYDIEEAKKFFEANFSHLYLILYDLFSHAEHNLRQKELSFHLVHKAGREDLEGVLFILEKIVCLLPEFIQKRWHMHSISRIFIKLLNRGNSQKLRAVTVKYFLLWYQCLDENAPPEIHRIFATIVPGFPEPSTEGETQTESAPQETAEYNVNDIMQHPNFASVGSSRKSKAGPLEPSTEYTGKRAPSSIFHDSLVLNPTQNINEPPLLPPSGHEKPLENETKFYLEILLEGMTTTITKVHWKERSHDKSMNSFTFLLNKFRLFYLPTICPQYDNTNSLYKPNLHLPVQHNILEDDYVQCRVILIKWIVTCIQMTKRTELGPSLYVTANASPSIYVQNPKTFDDSTSIRNLAPQLEDETSFNVTPESIIKLHHGSAYEDFSSNSVIGDVLYGNRDHVNFIIEILRQAFLLPFSQSTATRKVITLYKDWIQQTVDLPLFLFDMPIMDTGRSSGASSSTGSVCAAGVSTPGGLNDNFTAIPPPRKLRSSGYMSTVQTDATVCAGMQNVLQVFMTQASNVFLATQSPVAAPGQIKDLHYLTDEQTDTCKRVLNIYRYMVMHNEMNIHSWEQLLLVLLQITSLVLAKTPQKRKQDSLGGALAPAIFQTLIVTWIKAHLNVTVKDELWQKFIDVLTRLTHWDDLIKEWAKTMETLTRVLARHVYNLDLTELKDKRTPRRHTNEMVAAEVKKRPADSRSNPKISARLTDETRENFNIISYGSSRRHVFSKSEPNLGSPMLLEQYTGRRKYSLDANCLINLCKSGSRTPSPTLSSLKESPLQNMDLASEAVQDWSEISVMDSERSVVCGGTARGWLPDVAAVLWRRMLGALGNPNSVRDPVLHLQVYKYLLHLNSTLIKILNNQSASGNVETHVPLNLVAGWCIEAQSLPTTHRQGKLAALKLLCTLTQASVPNGPQLTDNHRQNMTHLPLYYRVLQQGLTCQDRTVLDVIIRHAAPNFISLGLEGYSILLLDFVQASFVILSSDDLSSPRTEAVTFLGSVLSLPDSIVKSTLLQSQANEQNIADVKNQVINILTFVCRNEPTSEARIAALSFIGTYVYHILTTKKRELRIVECVGHLLRALDMNCKGVAKVSSDLLLTLADHTDKMMDLYSIIPHMIIRTICECLYNMSSQLEDDGCRALVGNLLLALAEYCIRIGTKFLKTVEKDKDNLLLTVFKVLYAVMGDTSIKVEKYKLLPLDPDFNHNISHNDTVLKPLFTTVSDVRICAKMVCKQLLQYLGQWPTNPSCQLSSSVSEHDDSGCSDISNAVLQSPAMQFFTMGPSKLASLVELPMLPDADNEIVPDAVTSDKQVRIILRDETGKSCWDASPLYFDPRKFNASQPNSVPVVQDSSCSRDMLLSSLPPPFPENVLPDDDNRLPDMHQLDHLLRYITHTSPEVMCYQRPLYEPADSSLPQSLEDETIAVLLQHKNAEDDYIAKAATLDKMGNAEQFQSTDHEGPEFEQCRLFLNQFGALGWDQRDNLYLARRSERLVREMKNLDSQRCRETHKIAVIFVGRGQEDRDSILSNTSGSTAYEAFLAALAWEVDLESHDGFLGGLQKGGSSGISAPYISTFTLEALFHVATRMPSDTPEAILNKTRHLGNDEVHIVWSEHWKDYKRDILPTQFCDILIVLYPLSMGLVRCTVTKKLHVPTFGPLPSNIVLTLSSAAGLIRSAAFCGGRVVRCTMPFFQHAYSERARNIDSVVSQHKDVTTFEGFVERLLEPIPKAKEEGVKEEKDKDEGTIIPKQITVKKRSGVTSSNLTALMDQTSNTGISSQGQHQGESSASPKPQKRYHLKYRETFT